MKYRKKPVEVESIQYTGKNLPEIINFVSQIYLRKPMKE